MAAVDTGPVSFPAPPPQRTRTGERFAGRFELQALLGRGGMGEVWVAWDRVLGREVALKIIPADGLSDRTRERIRREVSTARDLSHPGLVRYYDLHEDGGRLGLSMERVPGGTLQEALERQGSLPEARIRAVLVVLAEALGHLHARGVIHRDIKPSNIFLTAAGGVKLGDFGIVHLEDEPGLTRTGETPGTPTHMAPEQFLGEPPAPASDWYALGIVVYEMATGRAPFTGTYGTVAAGHLGHPIPTLPPGAASGSLRRLIEGLLVKDPHKRWNGGAVERYAAGRTLPLLPRQRRLAGIAGVAFLAAVVVAMGARPFFHPPPTAIQVRGESVAAYAGDRLLWESAVDGLTDALLIDTDGDGDREVALGRWIDAGPGTKGIQVEVLEPEGRPGAPLFLSQTLSNVFPAFHPRYETVLRDAGAGRLAIFIQHAQFYPTYGALWDGAAGKAVFTLAHSGRLYRAVPFHGGAAFDGINNRLLHQRALLVTGPLGSAPAAAHVVDDVNQVTLKGMRAYHLLGDSECVFLDGPERARVRLPAGQMRKVLSNGDLEGLPGSGARSIKFALEYRRVRDALLQGDLPGGGTRAAALGAEASASGLTGYSALFAALAAEADARGGKWQKASRAAEIAATAMPGFDQDLRIQGALYSLLAGDPARAKDLLDDISSEYMGSRRDEVRTLIVWVGMLQSPAEGRALLRAAAPLLASSPYWVPYMDFQEGWIALLEGDAAGARAKLAPALAAPGMEHHAAGHFLAARLAGAFRPVEFEAYLDFSGTRPEYLLWTGAVCNGDREAAARHWALLEQEAFHTLDSALMAAVLARARDAHPSLR